ncbi:phage tail protein [Acinetobacter baumannii]|uniref:phage tail fiber protein n=1 Tax=Acinetobacter baumannii TaxID=470 RepID=UPI0024497B06|nr:phage tail protein [Acinetobacter baumannii]MDH2526310.1 phage tail protein [Acinetobacter baumannii]
MANLVFKYSWDHRPFPYNSAQGKRQFMLPFASGIPNLTPNISQVQGAGTAAQGTLTIARDDSTPGRVLKVGDFGLGTSISHSEEKVLYKTGFQGLSGSVTGLNFPLQCVVFGWSNTASVLGISATTKRIFFNNISVNVDPQVLNLDWIEVRTTANTTVDANGFVKSASPIVKLFAGSIELNDSAKKQPVEFEKIDVGNYLLKGSLGFAQEGWYIEVPKDANGNTVVAVEYSSLDNGDLSIQTFKRKFDIEKAAIVADHDNPLDIPEGRWIDIRLHEEPEPVPEEILSETPVEFQPTNLSQAVAAAMNGMEPPEVSDTDATP